jgi:hypothetical protein
MKTLNTEEALKKSDEYHAVEINKLREVIDTLNSKVESLEDELDATLMSLHDLRLECFQYESTLKLIACPPRSDGTYNRDRKACEMLAKDVLSKYNTIEELEL